MKKKSSYGTQSRNNGRESRQQSETIDVPKKIPIRKQSPTGDSRDSTPNLLQPASFPELLEFNRLAIDDSDDNHSKKQSNNSRRNDGGGGARDSPALEEFASKNRVNLEEEEEEEDVEQQQDTEGDHFASHSFQTPPKIKSKRLVNKSASSIYTSNGSNGSVPPRKYSASPNEEIDPHMQLERARILRGTPPPNLSVDHSKRVIGERWQGRLDYPNNSFYIGGLFKKDNGQIVRDGIGTSFDTIKSKVFEGSFEDDFKNGYGTTRYVDKVHQGQYAKGLRHGYGVFMFANGEKYEGEFHRGELHGQGKMTWKDGSTFEGTFRKGKLRRGLKHWADKDKEYEGTFDEHGLPSGYGTMTYSNGSYYKGMFRGGLYHGNGMFFNSENGTKTYQMYLLGRPAPNSRVMIMHDTKANFIGERCVSWLPKHDPQPHEESEGNDCNNRKLEPLVEKTVLLGTLEGTTDADEDAAADDRVMMQMGTFVGKDYPPRMVRGTYTTRHTMVTAQKLDPGPLVAENMAAVWHDMESGNVRWARLGPEGVGPIGKALFVYANRTNEARIETFLAEGEVNHANDLVI